MSRFTVKWRKRLRPYLPADIELRKVGVIALFFAVLCSILSVLNVGVAIEDYLARKAEFATRSMLGRDPLLSPKLKVFIFDDLTVSLVQATDIELRDWATVLEALAAAGPRHILIDKLFDLPKGVDAAAEFNERVGRLKVPVLTGGFVTPTAISGRPELKLDSDWNNLLTLGSVDQLQRSATDFPAMPANKLFAYGPHPKIAAALNHVGQIVYGGGGRAWPLMRLDAQIVLPHMGLMIADDLHLAGGQLFVNHRPVALHEDQVQVNLSNPVEFARRSYSMRDLIRYARAGKKISVVSPGDEVLILPAMFTGSTDWFTTPAGQLPGGYLVAGMINSVLTGVWLHDLGGTVPLIFLATFMGAVCGFMLSARRFWIVALLTYIGVCVGGLMSFAYLGIMVPWLYTSIGFFLTGLTIFAERSRSAHIQQVKMDRELETAGLVQRSLFPKLTTKPGSLVVKGFFKPAEQCGGDWWWHFSPRPGLEYVLIGDAMGHGVPAALVTGLMYACMNTLIETWNGIPTEMHAPARILQLFNRVLYSALEGEVIMTMFVARFDTHIGSLTFANAGHRFPVFMPMTKGDFRAADRRTTPRAGGASGPGGAATMLTATGNVLGIANEANFQERTLELRAGDRFVLYTDGVVEHIGPDKRPWGQKALIARAADLARLSADGIITGLVETMTKRLEGLPQADDYTLVTIEVPDDWQRERAHAS